MSDTIPWIVPSSMAKLLGLIDQNSVDDLRWVVTNDSVEFYFDAYNLFYPEQEFLCEILKEDLDLLEQCYVDIMNAAGAEDVDTEEFLPHLGDLFSCRKEGMRPISTYYFGLSPELTQLFDGCGPERTDLAPGGDLVDTSPDMITFDETGALSPEDIQKLLGAIFPQEENMT